MLVSVTEMPVLHALANATAGSVTAAGTSTSVGNVSVSLVSSVSPGVATAPSSVTVAGSSPNASALSIVELTVKVAESPTSRTSSVLQLGVADAATSQTQVPSPLVKAIVPSVSPLGRLSATVVVPVVGPVPMFWTVRV